MRVSIRQLAIPLSMFLIMGLLMWAFFQRFTVAIDPQEYRCLPHWLFLIDRHDTNVQTGDLVGFVHTDGAPMIRAGTRLIKYYAAGSGSKVVIDQDVTVIDGQAHHVSMRFGLRVLKERISSYQRTEIVPDDHMFLMGTTPTSNDSRFWGSVPKNAVIGKAYVLL
ncbi:S26 family signal peptidase [Neiella marina]|uniref:S26 family signal peptidase n=1 Tax=Neiella holothuriorum TaxID=2870530 RepID=A0ABS7EHR2_9GAMM|nr:S26 family signal peptidase [Neiella holothuriorum]MBW8191291.1 S26 family signal peptidase [Neiella holothuriorum]